MIACQGIRKAAEENVIGQAARAKISNGNRAPPQGLPRCVTEGCCRQRGLQGKEAWGRAAVREK